MWCSWSAAFLGLSTVRQPLARSGTEGAQRLCALLRGERLRTRRAELPLELVTRASTAPAPGAPASGAPASGTPASAELQQKD